MSLQNILSPNLLNLWCHTLNGFTIGPQGEFTGPQGLQGSQGSQGPQGIQGSQGSLANTTQLNGVIYYLNNNLSVANDTNVAVVFDTADETNSRISYNLSTGAFTINVSGIYIFSVSISFAANATGFREVFFERNLSGTNVCSSTTNTVGAGNFTNLTSTYSNFFNAGESIQAFIVQNSGSNLNLIGFGTSSTNYCQMDISIITAT